jgi:hypothetical protein
VTPIWGANGTRSLTSPGSSVAAAEAVGYDATGVELDAEYFRLAERAIPRLAALYPDFKGSQFEMDPGRDAAPRADANQLDFALAEEPAAYAAPKARPRPVAR